jgi:integrase/recombinase XerD
VRLADEVSLYLKSLAARGYAPRTVETYRPHLAGFVDWAQQHGLERVTDVDLGVLRAWQQDLAGQTSRYGRPLSVQTQAQKLGTAKSLFAFLVRRGVLLADPARDLELPRLKPRALPYGLPTPAEMARLLEVPDTTTPWGLRDRAVLELLYSTGLRHAELRRLRIWDVDLGDGTVTVVRGKGQKDRVVPLGRVACRWVGRYLTAVRPLWAGASDTLFLTSGGKPLHVSNLNELVKACARTAGVVRRVTVHTFRHACATHMLRAGADIRHLQKLLGHRSPSSTAIYTHVEIRDLKRVHRRCHPRVRRRRTTS